MKVSLAHEYIKVNYNRAPDPSGLPGGINSTYGGNQRLHPDKGIKKYGCGPLAATDVISYINGRYEYNNSEYERLLSYMCRNYFRYVPRVGTSGFVIRHGLNKYFRKHGVALKASWGVPRKKLYETIISQLKNNIPVIITAGRNIPGIIPVRYLPLYQKNDFGGYDQTAKTNGHFMVITGISGNMLRVSSWGKIYYIDLEEYLNYAKKYSFYYYTNIVAITPVGERS